MAPGDVGLARGEPAADQVRDPVPVGTRNGGGDPPPVGPADQLRACTPLYTATVQGCLSSPTQTVLFAADAAGTVPPIPDDMALLRVTRPDTTVASRYVIRYGSGCQNSPPPLPPRSPGMSNNTSQPLATEPPSATAATNAGFPGPVDITSLFGGQVGEFTLTCEIRNSDANGRNQSPLYIVPSAP